MAITLQEYSTTTYWIQLGNLLHEPGIMEELVSKICETDGDIETMSFEIQYKIEVDTYLLRSKWWSRKYKQNCSSFQEIPKRRGI